MITGKLWDLHDEATLWKFDAAAVRLLTQTGLRIHHEELLDIMGRAGCRIDKPAMRCYFSEKLIRETIEHLRGGGTGEVKMNATWNPATRTGHGGTFPHLLDWPSGRRKLAGKQDVIDMAKMAQMLDEITGVGKVLNCCEVDQRLEPLWSAITLAETTSKPVGGGETFYAGYIEPLVRMGEVLSGRPGDTGLVAPFDFFIAPLIFDRKQAECFLEKRRFKIALYPGTMAISGMSAPVTIAGTVVVATAELLAGFVMGYVVDPSLPVGFGITATGSLDMRTTNACFGSPEALLQDLAVCQVFRRLYGIFVGGATGYVDCKRPGIEATYQKMFPMTAGAMGLGSYPSSEGLLSAGQDYSPVQHMLDLEIAKSVERFWGHFEVNDETLAVELIEQIARGQGADFLQTDHTLSHFRSEQWYPRWFDRKAWQGDAVEAVAERDMLNRIDAYCKDAIVRYQRPAIDEKKVAELRRIYNANEARLLAMPL
ncbi:MAG: trimethylamine methyltransferase family protein [Planctomycetaceae bacterium]|nr:trimethylamine methyltransferase family protein [Planctomycetaceae bacterium]